MSNISKHFQRVKASLEARESQELHRELTELSEGELSLEALAIDDAIARQGENLSDLVQCVHAARNDENDAREFRAVVAETSAVREAMEAVNSNGGFTLESFHFARLAMNAPLRRLGVSAPLELPALESLTDVDGGKFQVSLENVDELIDQVQTTRDDVQKKSVDGILRVLDSLQNAMPDIKDRMLALSQSLPSIDYDETKEIRIDGLIFKSLAVEGRLPTGFKDFLTGYALNANRILSTFSENALVSATKAGELGDTIGGIGANACPIEALSKAIKDIGDPRQGIEPDALMYCLPGSGPLFGSGTPEEFSDDTTGSAVDTTDAGLGVVDQVGQAPTTENESPVVQEVKRRIEKFVSDFLPLDPLAWSDRPEEGDSAGSLRVLSKDTILAGLCELIKAIEIIDIKSFGDAHRQVWMSARSAFNNYQVGKDRLRADQASALNPLDDDVCEYLDTVFELSVWPVLHLLVNIVLTANAFVLLAERSITGESAEEPTVLDPIAEEADPAMIPEVPVDPEASATDTPPVEEPIVDDPLAVEEEPLNPETPTTDPLPEDVTNQDTTTEEDEPQSGGDGQSDDAQAAAAGQDNNDALDNPDLDTSEEDEESGLAGAAI